VWKKLTGKIVSALSARSRTFPEVQPPGEKPIANTLADNQNYLREIFANCTDFVVRPFKLGKGGSVEACIVYIDGLIDKDFISRNLMQTLMFEDADLHEREGEPLYKRVYDRLLAVGKVTLLRDMNAFVGGVVAGQLGLFLNSQSVCFILGVTGGESRDVSEAPTEAVIRGPREGFVEDIRVNTSLIRRRIKSPRLKFEKLIIGTLTQTEVNIAYIEGLVMENLVQEIKQRLQRIQIDGIVESGYIEEFIEDTPKSVFGQTGPTERPDRVVTSLLEGRAAIMVDTTPFALVVPVSFPLLMQSAEDYYTRFSFGTFMRFLRFLTINFALILPGFYIAVTSFHQEMMPSQLLLTLAAIREGLPFPVFVETFAMEFTFEIIREAGVRLPRQVGPAVSIVGALVIGDAAVNAGLVSPATIIVVALTAISNLTLPTIEGANTIRILRFPLMLMASAFGLIGLLVGLLLILIHICSLRSFGVPYLAPIAPLQVSGIKDTIIRVPWWLMRKRPLQTGKRDLYRQPVKPKGRPPKEETGQ